MKIEALTDREIDWVILVGLAHIGVVGSIISLSGISADGPTDSRSALILSICGLLIGAGVAIKLWLTRESRTQRRLEQTPE